MNNVDQYVNNSLTTLKKFIDVKKKQGKNGFGWDLSNEKSLSLQEKQLASNILSEELKKLGCKIVKQDKDVIILGW